MGVVDRDGDLFTESFRDACQKDSKLYENEPHAWIQWKGTNVCMDVHCPCGFMGHIDHDFAYLYRCRECGQHYAVGGSVKLFPLSAEAAAQKGVLGSHFLEDETKDFDGAKE